MADTLAEVFSRQKNPSAALLKSVVVDIKKLQKNHPHVRNQGYYDRLQRASSWLAKAKQAGSDTEAIFIFLWIALDALCSIRLEVLETDWWKRQGKSVPIASQQRSDDKSPSVLEWFLWRICCLDAEGRLLRSVIEDHWSDVETVLNARYIMSLYWNWQWKTETNIEKQTKRSVKIAKDAIGLGSDKLKLHQALCGIVIWRLRTLRNQLFHGSATDAHSRRRAAGESELETGSRLLEQLIWTFMVLMVEEPPHTRYWPPSPYPRVGSAQHERFNAAWLPE